MYLCQMKYCFLANIGKRRLLRKVQKPRVGKYVSLSSAKHCGVVFDASAPDIEAAISLLQKTFKAYNISYRAVYVDFRKQELRKEPMASDNILLLNFSKRKWNGLPKNDITEFFTEKPFDILLDLTQNKRVTPLEYLFSAAEASTTVGVCRNRFLKYDLTVSAPKTDTKDKTDSSALELAKNIITYLESINQ